MWAWGDNSSGQLGIGYTGGFVTVPTRVGTDTDWVDIAAGYKFSLALKSDGTLWAWGYNISGQLGDGTGITSGKDKPIKIPIFGIDLDSQTKVKSFAAGYYHAVAVTEDGKLWAWGDNGFGELGNGDTTGADVYTPIQVGTDTNWQKVAAGGFHSLAIKTDGTLYAFGNNSNGQLGYSEETVKCLTPFDPASFASCTNYEIVSINQPDRSSPTRVCTGSKIYTKKLQDENGNPLQSIFTATLSCSASDINWSTIEGGEGFSLGVKTDGTLWAFGYNGNGQLGYGAVPPNNITIATQISSVTNVNEISAGAFHSLLIKNNGTLWSAGYNFFGQLGTSSNNGNFSFLQATLDNTWAKINASGYHSLGIKNSPPSLWAWGRNNNGQLGDGSTNDTNTPIDISFPKLSILPVSRVIDFGNISLGSETGSSTFSLKNIGFKSVTINSIDISGDTNEFVVVENSCNNTTLNFNATCTISYKFRPFSSGVKTLNIAINSNDISEAQLNLRYKGTGISTVNITKSGYGNGVITSFPLGINCGSTCSQNYDSAKEITLYATADQGSEFVGWGGDCSGNTCVINTSLNKNISAIFKEIIAPTGEIKINNNDVYTNSSNVNLQLTCTDSGSGCSQTSFSEDEITWSDFESFSSSKSYTLNQIEGEKTIYVKFKDNDGNISQIYSDKIIFDNTPPTTYFYPSGGSYHTNQLITMYTNEPATIYYSLDDSFPTNVYTGVISIDNTSTLKFYAQDLAGNTESIRTVNYVIDKTPPLGTITINNNDIYTKINDVTLTLTCSDAGGTGCSQMRFSEDGIDWTSPENFSVSKTFTISGNDGTKIIYVSFKDNSGNWSAPVNDTIILDKTPPNTTISPNGGSYNLPQIVDFSTSENATIYYTTDESLPSTSSNIYTTPLTISTTTTLKFFAIDTAGNSENIQTVTFTIDSTPPEGTVTINSGLIATNNRDVTLSFNVSGITNVTDVQITNDIEPTDFSTNVFSYPPSNSYSWTLSSGDGVKTVFVRFKNQAGNWSNIVSDTIILDTLLPTISASKVSGSYNSTLNISVSCSDESGSGCDKIYYTLDGSVPSASSPLYSTPIQTSENKTLRIIAIDKAQNWSQVQTYIYTIDTIPPTGTITINGGYTYTSSVYTTLTLSGSESNSQTQMQFSLDGTNWTSTEPYNTTKIFELDHSDGQKTVCVRYNDAAGNWSAPICDNIILDQTPPITTASLAAGLYNTSLSLDLTVNEPATICYTLDGTDPIYSSTKHCQNPTEQKITISIVNSITIKFSSFDRSQNYETIKTLNFTIDKVSPTGTITINEGAYTKSTTVNLTLVASDENGVAKMQFSNDGVNWSSEENYATTKTWQLNATDGEKTVYARFKDNAGNWSQPTTAKITLDTQAPKSFSSHDEGTYTGTITIALSANEPNSKIYYTIDSSAPPISWSLYTTQINILTSSTLKFFSIDLAGNSEPINTLNFIIKFQGEVNIKINNGDTYTNALTVNLSFSSQRSITKMQLSENNITWTQWEDFSPSKSWTFSNQSEGTKTILGRFKDEFGNISDISSASIIYDNTPPITIVSVAGGLYNTSKQITLSSEQNAKIYYTLNGTEPTETSTIFTGPINISQTTTLKYFSKDLAGNKEAIKTEKYIIDTLPPTGTIAINNGNDYTNSKSVTITLNATDENGLEEFQLSNDNINWSPAEAFTGTYNKSWSLTSGDEEKTVYARFKDKAQNWSNPVSAKITLDSTLPTTTPSHVSGVYNNGFYLTLKSDEKADIYYSLDNGTNFSKYTEALYVTSNMNVKFYAIDKAGNQESTQEVVYEIDFQPPLNTVINNKAGYTNNKSIVINFSFTKPNEEISIEETPVSMRFSNDGTNFSQGETFSNDKTLTLLDNEGLQTIYVQFKDIFGNWSKSFVTDITQVSITYDITAPRTEISPKTPIINSVPETINLSTLDESPATIYYSLDGGQQFNPYSEPFSINTSTTIQYYAEDKAGNKEEIKTMQYTVTITPALKLFINNGDVTTNKTNVTLSLVTSNSSKFAKIQFSNDGSNWSPEEDFVTSKDWYLTSVDGEKTVYVRIRDIYGNISKPITANITLDSTAPKISSSLAAGKYYDTQTVTFTADEEATIYYTTNGELPTNNSLQYNSPIQITTNTTLKFFGIDSAGNKSEIQSLDYLIIPKEAITPIGTNGIVREDGGSVLDNKDPQSGKPSIDINFKFGLIVKDNGGNPKSVKIFVTDKSSPIKDDYVVYDLTCTGDYSTGAQCVYETKLGISPNLSYYFEVQLSDGNVIKYPQSRSYKGPQIEMLEGYNIIGIPRNISENDNITPQSFNTLKAYKWISHGLTTNKVNGNYVALSSNDTMKLGEGYFILKDSSTTFPSVFDTISNINSSPTRIAIQPGWNLIANPYPGNVKLRDIKIINSKNEKLNWLDAATQKWIYNAVYYYKGKDFGNAYAFESAGGDNEAVMIPWIGYWMYLSKSDGNYFIEIPKP